MLARRIFMIVVTVILIAAVSAGIIQALEPERPTLETVAVLSNVRDYVPASSVTGPNYAVDGGKLFVGDLSGWTEVATPQDVIVGAVAADRQNPSQLYIGAANELALYRSSDGGRNWLAVPLDQASAGGVTDIAVDSVQRLVYVATDTAGLFRLRDVGSSLIVGGQLLLDEPVLEVVTDNTGLGLAFARTEWDLYRAENYGLSWVQVTDLHSAPTALAVADTTPAAIYVGTVDRGLLVSHDGLTWTPANEGLGFVPGSRLQVDALAVDPAQPQVLYVATSYLFGSTTVHQAPKGVAMSADGALAWTSLDDAQNVAQDVAVAELLPVPGRAGAVYALTTESRTPLALGIAPELGAVAAQAEAGGVAAAETAAAQAPPWTGWLAWLIAGLAGLALAFAVVSDLLRTRRQPAVEAKPEPSPVHNNG